jgi:hypothetical protein
VLRSHRAKGGSARIHTKVGKLIAAVVLAVVAMTTFAAAPVSAAPTITTTTTDPGYTLVHSYSLSGGGPCTATSTSACLIELNKVNSCIRSSSSHVQNRYDYCRVVDGYEGIDNTNWIVRFPLNESPLYQYGSDTSSTGRAIVLANGQMYSGCDYRSPDNSYLCDYRERKGIVRTVGTSATFTHYLKKFWNWSNYIGNALGCAGGIAGYAWGNKIITAPLIADCVDGPM